MALREGDEEFAVVGVLEREELGLLAEVVGVLFHAEVAADAAVEVDDEIRELVLVGASALELKKKAIERGMITLRRSGLTKVALGMTTLEEVARETIH